MVIPAAMQIYSGATMLRDTPESVRTDQQKELRAAIPTLVRMYGIVDSLSNGYELGLAVARLVIAMTPPGEKIDL